MFNILASMFGTQGKGEKNPWVVVEDVVEWQCLPGMYKTVFKGVGDEHVLCLY